MLSAKRTIAKLILAGKRWAEIDTLPRYMALVRHGLSEANKVRALLEDGEIESFPQQYLQTPDREMRLEAEIGELQPKVTGEWIRQNCPAFTFATAADHVRAYETAGNLGLGLNWYIDCFYGERYWGEIDSGSADAREKFYELRKRDPMHATPPNGERLLSARLRARVLLERGARQHSLDNFLGVFHGEMIEAIICELLHLNTEEFHHFDRSPLGKMGNCQVVEFTRVSPWSARVHHKMVAMRSSNPFKKEFGEWVRIDDLPFARKKFDDQQLLSRAQRYPRFLVPSAT